MSMEPGRKNSTQRARVRDFNDAEDRGLTVVTGEPNLILLDIDIRYSRETLDWLQGRIARTSAPAGFSFSLADHWQSSGGNTHAIVLVSPVNWLGWLRGTVRWRTRSRLAVLMGSDQQREKLTAEALRFCKEPSALFQPKDPVRIDMNPNRSPTTKRTLSYDGL